MRDGREERTGPAWPVDRRRAVDERVHRSVEELLDVRVRQAEPFPVLEVRNPLRGTSYRVFLPEFPGREGGLCTCTDFARRDLGTCKHLEAGYRWLTEHPAAPAPRAPPTEAVRGGAVWREIDRRLRAIDRGGDPESLRWRWPGSVLFERRTAARRPR